MSWNSVQWAKHKRKRTPSQHEHCKVPSRGHTRCADTTNRDLRIVLPGAATSSIRFAQCREYMNLLSVANTRKRSHGHVQCEVVQGAPCARCVRGTAASEKLSPVIKVHAQEASFLARVSVTSSSPSLSSGLLGASAPWLSTPAATR